MRTPTILQMESAECGAAALAMVLAFHGRWLPLEELRAACGVSRDGCKASNILRAARNHGLSAQGMRLDREALSGQAMPVILFWQFNHFLVLEGFRRGHAWVNDPACGRRKLGLEEFDRCYTGIALCFAPGPGFQRGGVPRSMRAALLPRLRGVGRPLSFVLLASLALVAPGLALPVFAQVFVDAYLVENLEGWLRPLLLGMAVTALLRGLLTWLQQLHLLRLETQLALAGSAAFVWHVLRLPVTFFSQRFAGDIAQRVDSNNRVALLLSGDLSTNAAGLLMLGFYALVMFAYDWQLTLVCLVLTSLNVLLLLRVARMRKDASLYLQQERGKLLATVAGGIQTMETIKASGAEQDFFQRWCGQYVKTFNVSQELQLQARMLAAVPLLISGLITAAILGLGGVRVMEGSLSVGMLVAFQSLVASFFQPVRNLMTLAGKAQEAQADLVRLDDVLRYPVDPAFGAAADEAGAAADASIDASRIGARLQGWLELRNLRFGYSRLEPPLIDDFSLRLAPGQRVALVGASGSGKSTIARIVLGLHQPWSGQILFDGQPRAHWPALLMCASLGAVDQEPVLFQGSVRDNLSLWDVTLPETDMVRAAHDAMIHEAIAERPEGYDSLIAEGGANFSGGQRQRLEIARALAGNPSILVLDEATSALDPATEKMIDERLRRRGCTCLIVAHRLSTIRDCDEIIVMDGGRILERGTHDALLSRPGAYRRLIGEIAA